MLASRTHFALVLLAAGSLVFAAAAPAQSKPTHPNPLRGIAAQQVDRHAHAQRLDNDGGHGEQDGDSLEVADQA